MELKHKNFKEDFKLLITLGKNYAGEDFRLRFTSGKFGQVGYECSRKSGVLTNCEMADDTHVLCLFDNHGLPCGKMYVETTICKPDAQMPDGNFLLNSKEELVFMYKGKPYGLELTNGKSDVFETVEVTLDIIGTVIQGENAYQIAVRNGYKGTEEEWIASFSAASEAAAKDLRELENSVKKSELSRQSAESSRVSAEQDRMKSEGARASSEENRVSAEDSRALAEGARATAETVRAKEENARKQAENNRATVFLSLKQYIEQWHDNTKQTVESWYSTTKQGFEAWFTYTKAAWTAFNDAAATDENTRKQNETARATAESERTTAFNTLKKSIEDWYATTKQTVESWYSGIKQDWTTWFTATKSAWDTWFANTKDAWKTFNDAVIADENTRKQQETTRQQAEASRATAENSRASAESARVSAESTRQQNETSRQQAETQRGTTFTTNEQSRQQTFSTAEVNRQQTFDRNEEAREQRVATAITNAKEAADEAREAAEYAKGGKLRISAGDMLSLLKQGTTDPDVTYLVTHDDSIVAQYYGSTPVHGLELAIIGRVKLDQSAIA